MVTVRTKIFEVNKPADIAFSIIDWRIEKVKRLVNPFLGLSTTDTTKPWVGRIDREKMKFKIIQTAPYLSPRFLEGNFFQLYIRGQVFSVGEKSKISLKFAPGLNTILLFVLLYSFPVIIAVSTFGQGGNNWKDLALGFLIPLAPTLLFILQLNTAEKKLVGLFET